MKISLSETIRSLASQKKYIYYSMAFGLSSLILPLGIQFLVNNLALSGIWFNTITFLLIIGVGLFFAHVVRYSQVILMETLQREIFVYELARWKNFDNLKSSHYFFEIPNLLKSFSKAFSHLTELVLLLVFGLTTIVLFHPAFLIIPIFVGMTLFLLYKTFTPAIQTSISESNRKYEIFDRISDGLEINDTHLRIYLEARDLHFSYTRSNTFKVSTLIVLCQILLLGFGSYLIKQDQLSVGQLVSAEIIISGIFISMLKLPQTLESVFDYETSQFKISKALQGAYHE